jgi:hypothetical protein
MVKCLIAETLCIFNTPNLFFFPNRMFVLLSEVNLVIRQYRMREISKLSIKKLRDSKGTELD